MASFYPLFDIFPGVSDSRSNGFSFAGQRNRDPQVAESVLNRLPVLSVTLDDWRCSDRRNCAICQERLELGQSVLRLPCAHLYHIECITQWFNGSSPCTRLADSVTNSCSNGESHHCMCPQCNYELETSDPEYEIGRLERMRDRSPRILAHEQTRLSVRQILSIADSPMPENCWERQDVIDALCERGTLEVVRNPGPYRFRNSFLDGLGRPELFRMVHTAVGLVPRDLDETSSAPEDVVKWMVDNLYWELIPEVPSSNQVSPARACQSDTASQDATGESIADAVPLVEPLDPDSVDDMVHEVPPENVHLYDDQVSEHSKLRNN